MPLSKRDNDILTLASKGETADTIAVKLGASAERVVQEIERLTKSLDWLSEAQKYVLLRHKLWTFVNEMEKATQDQGYDSKVAEAYLRGLESAINQVDRARDRLGNDMDRVERAQAGVLMDVVEKAFYASMGQLRVSFRDAPYKELEDAMRENLVWIAAEMDAREGMQ